MPMHRSEVHVDAVLSNLARTYCFPEMIADLVSPRVKVKKDSDVYWTFGREEQRVKLDGEGDLRAPGEEAVSFDWKPTGAETYRVKPRAFKDFVLDDTVRNSDSVIRPMERTVEKLMRVLAMHRERRVAKLFTTGIASTFSPAVKWDLATADIEDDIRAGMNLFRMSSGCWPNTIIMNAVVAGYLRLYLKASADITLNEKASAYEFPKRLWGMNLIISEATMNTAGEGLTEVMVDVWPDTVTMAYINPSKNPTLQDSTFSWSITSILPEVRRWYDDKTESTWIEAKQYVDEKIVAPYSATTITDVLT